MCYISWINFNVTCENLYSCVFRIYIIDLNAIFYDVYRKFFILYVDTLQKRLL